MRTLLLLVLAITTFLIWLNRNDSSGAAGASNQGNRTARSAASATPAVVSEHDWAKNSLDRANEVAEKVRKNRQGDERP